MPQPEHSRSSRIEFVPFEVETALPDLRRWLADPDVRRWYDEGEPTTANLRRRFAPDPGVRACSILIDGCPAGYIQVYWLRDHPEYQRQVDVDPEAVSIDLFIGEPDLRGQGWGPEILRACLDRLVFGEMAAPLAMIAPDPANHRAVRSYGKAGFRAVKTVHVVDDEHPGNTGDELVMLLTRDEWQSRVAPGAKKGNPAGSLHGESLPARGQRSLRCRSSRGGGRPGQPRPE